MPKGQKNNQKPETTESILHGSKEVEGFGRKKKSKNLISAIVTHAEISLISVKILNDQAM